MRKHALTILNFLILFSMFASIVSGQNSKLWFTAFEKDNDFYRNIAVADIEIKEGKTILPVERLSEKTDMPLEVIVLIDASGSQREVMTGTKDVAVHFIENVLSEKTDKVAIVRFSAAPSLVCDLTTDLKNAVTSLAKIGADLPPRKGTPAKALSAVDPSAGNAVLERINAFPVEEVDKRARRKLVSSVWKSLKWTIDVFGELRPTKARRAIVLITDGVDTEGDEDLKDAIESSLRNHIPVFPIAINNHDIMSLVLGAAMLDQIAAETGGVAILPKNVKRKAFDVDLTQIDQWLRNYYEFEVSGAPLPVIDKFRKLDVRLINKDLRKSKVRIAQPRGFTAN